MVYKDIPVMYRMACCICLNTPTFKYPTYLLACGCLQSWFHKECEENWLNSIEDGIRITCPTCRQDVPFQNIYSFAYESGYEQKTVQHVIGLLCFESILYISDGLYSTPMTALGIISIPFIIPTPYTLHYFMDIAQWKMCIDLIFYLIRGRNFYGYYTSAIGINIFCLALFFLQSIVVCKKAFLTKDILLPYLIQSDIIHRSVLYSMKESPKSISNPPIQNTYLFRLPSILNEN